MFTAVTSSIQSLTININRITKAKCIAITRNANIRKDKIANKFHIEYMVLIKFGY